MHKKVPNEVVETELSYGSNLIMPGGGGTLLDRLDWNSKVISALGPYIE